MNVEEYSTVIEISKPLLPNTAFIPPIIEASQPAIAIPGKMLLPIFSPNFLANIFTILSFVALLKGTPTDVPPSANA